MKLEPISKEMFDVLYDIFYGTKNKNVFDDNKNAVLEMAKNKGLIKKTALEEARDSWHELNTSKKYSFDCHTYVKIVNIVNYYEKAIEEIKGERDE